MLHQRARARACARHFPHARVSARSSVSAVVLVKPELLVAAPGKQPTALAAFYAVVKGDKRTQKVLAGESGMGLFKQYFLAEE